MSSGNNRLNGQQVIIPKPPAVAAGGLNDVQLLSLMAPHCPGGTVAERVGYALDVVAESMVQFAGGKGLHDRIQVLAAQKAADAELAEMNRRTLMGTTAIELG